MLWMMLGFGIGLVVLVTWQYLHACDLCDEIDELQCTVDGLRSDLKSALCVLKRRIDGKADLESARVWLEMNYPSMK
jgi:hypothetical protein